MKHKQIDRLVGAKLYNIIHDTYIDRSMSMDPIKELDDGIWLKLTNLILVEQTLINSIQRQG